MHGIRSNTETALSEGPARFHIIAYVMYGQCACVPITVIISVCPHYSNYIKLCIKKILSLAWVLYILRKLSYKCPPIETRSPHSECQLPSNNVYRVHSNFSDFASSAKIAKIGTRQVLELSNAKFSYHFNVYNLEVAKTTQTFQLPINFTVMS